MASVGGFRVPGDCASRGREVGSGCVQQGGWRLDLGVHFLPTIGKRLRREFPGSWWGMRFLRAPPEVLGFPSPGL